MQEERTLFIPRPRAASDVFGALCPSLNRSWLNLEVGNVGARVLFNQIYGTILVYMFLYLGFQAFGNLGDA